jgi:hypothetical protein
VARYLLARGGARAPGAARFRYDFHLDGGYRNSSKSIPMPGRIAQRGAGGRARGGAAQEEEIVAMFREEWRLQRGDRPLRSIAIVDDAPATQYLYPEFLLFQAQLQRHGYTALVADAAALTYRDRVLRCGDAAIDLVYNRVTDFMLEQPAHAALRDAWSNGAVVLTPHPPAYAVRRQAQPGAVERRAGLAAHGRGAASR